MNIRILEFVEGARQAKGLTVIIDVFRAFSVACYASDAGAAKIIVTDEVSKAFDLRKSYKRAVLVGERDEKKIPGFDLGNSPTEIIKTDLTGRIVIHTTTAGTNGLINAADADMILTGSLVNAAAVAKYIQQIHPDQVSLVAMGYRATISAEEDLLCAEYIKSMITGKGIAFESRIADLRLSSGRRFFQPENLDFSPPTDYFLCTMTNRFNFILKAEKRTDGNINLERIEI
jgi:2-phosphosulfolactate phosphatase